MMITVYFVERRNLSNMFSLIVYFNFTYDKNIKIYNIIYIREVGFVSKPIIINNGLCK